MSGPMIVSEVGRTARGSSSSSMAPPARVTHATSGAKPSMCSASFIRNSRGMSKGKAQFSWPDSLIMSSKARMIASHIAQPYGRTTIMPRTPDQSASSALRTTSVYQRSKSSDILVTSFTKSCCSSISCFMAALRWECVLGSDRVDLGQKHWKELLLGHGPVKATPLKNHALAAAAGHADVRVPSLRRAVDDAAHHGDRDRHLELCDVGLDRLHRGDHVVLEAPARRARDQRRAFLAEGERLEDLMRDANLFARVRCGERDADGVADAFAQEDA